MSVDPPAGLHGGTLSAGRCHALAAALGVETELISAILAACLGGPPPDWSDEAVLRGAAALLRLTGARADGFARMAEEVEARGGTVLLRPAAAPRLAAAEAAEALAAAALRRDWLAAAPAVLALRDKPSLRGLDEATLLLLAEAACALGFWAPVPRILEVMGPRRRPPQALILELRALLGQSRPEEAWAALARLPDRPLPPAIIDLADAALAACDGALSGTAPAQLVAMLRALAAAGRREEALALARPAWRGALPAPLRRALLEARCALAPGGWASLAEARWARLLARHARRHPPGAAAAITRLTDCAWHREAFDALAATGADPGAETMLALAHGLAGEGALAEPAALLRRLMDRPDRKPGSLAALERHLALLRTLETRHGPAEGPRPATRLLLAELAAPAPRRLPPGGAGCIAHVATSFAVGGAERQLATVVGGIAARWPGVRQEVVISAASDGAMLPRGANIHPHMLRDISAAAPRGAAHPAIEGLHLITARAAMMNAVDTYRRVFEAMRPDAVMTWKPEISALIGAALAGVPRLLHRQGSVAPVERPGMRAPQRAVAEFLREGFRWLAPLPAAHFVANSAVALEDLRAAMHWPEERSSVLPNALDPRRFAVPLPRAEARARLGLPLSPTIIGGCFRIAAEKRPFLWLKAAEIALRRARGEVLFVVAGDGPLMGRLRAEIAARGLGDRVVLLGQVADAAAAHAAFDLLLHTAAFEGLPNAVVEGQWAGVPVVATEAGGTAEAFLPGVTGTLVRGDGAEAVAEALMEAIAQLPAYAARRGEFRRFVADRFSIDACLDRLGPMLGCPPVA